MAKVITTVKPDGKTEVRVEGIPGASCREASEPYLAVLPTSGRTDVETDEMYADTGVENREHETG